MTPRTIPPLRPAAALFLFLSLSLVAAARGDDYAVDPGNASLLVAAGCFWCAEQAFEQYAPGVVEAVSGYAGADGIDNPTYRNHPGHYEVVLVEYDPSKTTYELLVEYAWRNLDPFDGGGQFCDRGSSYKPAIFYADEEEREGAERVREKLLARYPEWDAADLAVPLLERPKFWTAEGYHQDYYIENPRNYGYYKSACGRTNRLKDVWGEEEYYCFHDLEPKATCFDTTTTDEEGEEAVAVITTTINEEGEEVVAVVNEEGETVVAEVNRKDAPEETTSLLPRWGLTVILLVSGFLFTVLMCFLCRYIGRRTKDWEPAPGKK